MDKKVICVNADDLVELVGAVKKIRSVFIICAPKFGAGSVGEAALTSALRLDPVLRAIEEKLK